MLSPKSLYASICKLKDRITALENAEPPTDKVYEETSERIIAVFASGTSTGITRNAAMQTNGLGQYSIEFDEAHPDGDDYEIVFGQGESDVTRDMPKVAYVRDSKTAQGFDVMVTVDDNGATADTYVNNEWDFAVMYEKEVLVPNG